MRMFLIITTIPSGKGEELVQGLLESRLSACISRIENAISKFHWKGKIETEREDILFIKTKEELVERVMEYIKQHHPYTVPEIVAIEVDKVNKEYLEWLYEETIK